MACLVLKEFLRLDYRGLADQPDFARLIDLETIRHHTTFQKAAERLLKVTPARLMYETVLKQALRAKVRERRVPLAAVDGTGMESRHGSRDYVNRRDQTGTGTLVMTYAKYPIVKAKNGRRWGGRNDQLDDRAAAGFGVPSAKLLESVPRDPPPGHHSSCDDSYVYQSFRRCQYVFIHSPVRSLS